MPAPRTGQTVIRHMALKAQLPGSNVVSVMPKSPPLPQCGILPRRDYLSFEHMR